MKPKWLKLSLVNEFVTLLDRRGLKLFSSQRSVFFSGQTNTPTQKMQWDSNTAGIVKNPINLFTIKSVGAKENVATRQPVALPINYPKYRPGIKSSPSI